MKTNVRFTHREAIKYLKEVHGDQYSYSRVKYKGTTAKIEIVCKKHGSFWQRYSCHKSGTKCPKCSFASLTLSREDWIKRFHELHGNRYDYSNFDPVNSKVKCEIVCRTHGAFKVSPERHYRDGLGCNVCSASKGEKLIHELLTSHSLDFCFHKHFEGCRYKRPLHYDFHVYDNILIEYDGEQHFRPVYGNEKLQASRTRDLAKDKWAKDNGYRLLRIPYTENNIEEKIIDFIYD